MEKKLSLGRNVLYNSVGSLTYLVCQWLINVLVVRLGSYADGGMLSLSVTLTNVFYVLATFSLRVYQASDVTGKFTATQYISTRVMTSLAGMGLCLMFTAVNRQYDRVQQACIILYMLFKLTEALVDTFAAEQQKTMRMDYVFRSFMMRSATSLGSFVLGMTLGHSLPLALALMALTTLPVVLLYDGRIVRKMTNFRVVLQPTQALPLLKTAWPMMINAAMMTLLTTIPRYFLEDYCGQEIMGIYASIATPAVIVQAGCSFVYSPLVAPLSEQYAAGDVRKFGRTVGQALLAVLILFAGVMCGAALLGNWGLQLLFGESILPYAWLLIPALLTSLCSALLYFFEVPLTIMGKLKTMTLVHLIAVAASVLFSMTMIPTMGMNGTNWVICLTAGADAIALGGITLYLIRKK